MRAIRAYTVCVLFLAAAWACIAGEAADDLSVSATGLCVVAPASEEALRAFNWPAGSGTSVTLLISSPKGGLVQLDGASSALSKFVDEKGNDLLARPAAEAGRPLGNIGLSLFPKISADGKSCAVEVNSPNTPAKGSATLRLEGVITMLVASAKTEHVQKDVALKNGSTITAEKLKLTVEHVAKTERPNEPLSFTLRSSMELEQVAEIKFFKEDGTEIKSRRTATSKMGIMGALQVEWDYALAESVDSVVTKVFLWSDQQKKKVPFALTITPGL